MIWLKKIIFLLNRKDVRCAMGRNARKYVQQHLSLDAISQQFYELISLYYNDIRFT